jgi:hypothetical protein
MKPIPQQQNVLELQTHAVTARPCTPACKTAGVLWGRWSLPSRPPAADKSKVEKNNASHYTYLHNSGGESVQKSINKKINPPSIHHSTFAYAQLTHEPYELL